MKRDEVERAIKKLITRKATGIDGITAKMLKYGGDVDLKWMLWICSLAWEQGKVSDVRRKAIIDPLYKDKGSRNVCHSYKGISLLTMPGKVYGRILNRRMMKTTELQSEQFVNGLPSVISLHCLLVRFLVATQ